MGLGELRLFLLAVYVERHHYGSEGPEGNGEFVGVEEVVEHSVDIVGEQAESEGQGYIGHLFVFGGAVDTDTGGESGHEDAYYQGYTREALFGHGADVFAVGVAQIAGIGADGGELVAALVAGIKELVGAGAASHDGSFFPHADGRSPTVEAFQVAGIGGDVRYGLDLTCKVVGAVLVVFAQLIEHVVLVYEKYADTDAEQEHHPLYFKSKTD